MKTTLHTRIVRFLVLPALAAIAFSCKPGDQPYVPSVYVAGTIYNGSRLQACYWKNGVRTDLSAQPEYDSNAYDIAVDGDTVYVVGVYGNPQKACLWVNGARQDLNGIREPQAIAVVNGTVYVAGLSTTNSKACVWVNASILEVPTDNSWANDLAVTADTIYLAGAAPEGVSKAQVWSRPLGAGSTTAVELLPSGYGHSEALGLAIADGQFSVVGYARTSGGYYDPYLWTGTSPASLSGTRLPTPDQATNTDAYLHDVVYANGTTYVAGHYSVDIDGTAYDRAALWVVSAAITPFKRSGRIGLNSVGKQGFDRIRAGCAR